VVTHSVNLSDAFLLYLLDFAVEHQAENVGHFVTACSGGGLSLEGISLKRLSPKLFVAVPCEVAVVGNSKHRTAFASLVFGPLGLLLIATLYFLCVWLNKLHIRLAVSLVRVLAQSKLVSACFCLGKFVLTQFSRWDITTLFAVRILNELSIVCILNESQSVLASNFLILFGTNLLVVSLWFGNHWNKLHRNLFLLANDIDETGLGFLLVCEAIVFWLLPDSLLDWQLLGLYLVVAKLVLLKLRLDVL